MKFYSTRDARTVGSAGVSFSEAVLKGLADDGGLFVPEAFPQVAQEFSEGIPDEMSYADFAARMLAPFVGEGAIADSLDEICRAAFDFPVPLKTLGSGVSILELFHGPTLAFKDFGARFLAEVMGRIMNTSSQNVCVMVATSGDTGGAVASAFAGKKGFRVCLLFPDHGVSPRQRIQLTCWGDNIRSFAVKGTFDDCQKLVKTAFSDPAWNARFCLTSANSINLGRLLPQSVYYAYWSLKLKFEQGQAPGFVIPTGNLGNAVAAFWAKKMGFPIRELVLATNANRSIGDYAESGQWAPRPSIPTLANAMDVGNPSNMERLQNLIPDWETFKREVPVFSVSDFEIAQVIQKGPSTSGEVWCPHTATAVRAYERMTVEQRAHGPWILVSTAHPCKFPETLEPLVARKLEIPTALSELLSRSLHETPMEPDLAALLAAM